MASISTAALDRAIAVLVVTSLGSVFVLPSQSAASFPTYLLAVAALWRGPDAARVLVTHRALVASLIALFGYFAASVSWSTDVTPRGAFSTVSRCILMLTFVAGGAMSMRNPEFSTWVARVVAIAAGVGAAAALVVWYRQPTWDGRLVGLGQLRSSVIAAMSFAAGLICALDVVLNDARVWRGAGVAAVLVIGAAVLATGSRAGYLGAAVGLWVIGYATHGARGLRARTWLAAPIVAACAVVASISVPGWRALVWPRADSFRLAIWQADWERIVDTSPWIGQGVLMREPVVAAGQNFAHPHSLYLATALQGGLLGLLLLAAVSIFAVLLLWRDRTARGPRLALGLMATGATAYLFDGWELIDKVSVSWLVIWLPVAVALGSRAAIARSAGSTLTPARGVPT